MPEPWWGPCALTPQQAACWCVGAVTLWVTQAGGLLRAARTAHALTEPARRGCAAAPGDSGGPVPAEAEYLGEFYVGSGIPDAVEVVPVAPDRPVVSRPLAPLYVAPGQAVTLYLETPLWLRLRLPGMEGALLDVPSVRLSDTWFGPSRLAGELAYASRLVAGTDPAAPLAAHLARTPLTYRNRTAAQIAIERIAIPAPALGIYAGTDGRLWTEALTVEQRGGDELALATVGRGAPAQAGAAQAVGPARARPTHASFALRAISALLHAEA